MNPTGTLTKKQFNDTYWFTSLQMVMVVNPKEIDWPFMVEQRHFIIKAGGKEEFPGVIANVYLDQMSKILAQDDDKANGGKLEYMSDPNLKKLYYDQLIVNVRSLVSEYESGPAYLKNVAPAAQTSAPSEKAPWEENMERASDVAPAPPIATPEKPQPPEVPEPKAETKEKEFELEGVKYKLVINKNGNEMYYKGGKMTDSATFHKAASLL